MRIPLPSDDDLPFGLFEKAVETLVIRARGRATLVSLTREHATLLVKRRLGSVQVTLLRFDINRAEIVEGRISALINSARSLPLDIVLVGGGEGARALLERPALDSKRVGSYHLGDAPESRESKTFIAHELLQGVDATPSDAWSWQRLVAESAEDRAKHEEQAEELAAFGALFKARRAWVTYALAGMILAVFALELFIGGATSLVVLTRMGALLPGLVSDGEIWRLLASTFLHGGWSHVLLNVFVLVLLGTFLEKTIGSARFLLLYVLAALGGSLGSLLFLEATLSVGASGALWGLFGAHAVLAFRSDGLLPTAMVRGARIVALFNLGIIFFNSFGPNIDIWAHFAGGAVGMALVASGLLTRGLPRLGELRHAVFTKEGAPSHHWPAPLTLRIAGALGGGLLVVGLALALVTGRPMQLRSGDDTARVALPRLGISALLPAGQRKLTVENEAGFEVMFGHPVSDPMTVALYTKRLPSPLNDATIKKELVLLKRALPPPPETTPHGAPRFFTIGKYRGVVASYLAPSGLVFDRAFLLRPNILVRAEVLRWPGFPRVAHSRSTEKLLSSVQVL